MGNESWNPKSDVRTVAILVLLALGGLVITTACVYPEGHGRGGRDREGPGGGSDHRYQDHGQPDRHEDYESHRG
jgi:hypothetical protein